jgi:hypothetical protein
MDYGSLSFPSLRDQDVQQIMLRIKQKDLLNKRLDVQK